MQVIPIQPVPSQQVLCVLGGQNCQISIYQRAGRGFTNLYVDLNSNGTNMFLATLAHNAVPLDPCNSYDGFEGNLFFIDTQGVDDPEYTGLGTRWFLVYLTPAELLLTAPIVVEETVLAPILTLSATLNVTSSAPGNFSVAHGLDVVPFLINIIPTSPGIIVGQSAFVDDTNVNLEASDTGVTATILVWTTAASGLETVSAAATLLVESEAPGAFTVAHGVAGVPSLVKILPTSGGLIWETAPADDTYLYLAASDAGITVTVSVYAPVSGALNIEGPATTLAAVSLAPGSFSMAHGLAAAPSNIDILPLSMGQIWAATPAFDETNVYLTASDFGVIAKILVYA